MTVLDIHLEGIKPESFRDRKVTHIFEDILANNTPVIVSLPPCLEQTWLSQCPQIIELTKEVVKRKGSALGQQGLNHKCKNFHRFADPWHENSCIWYHSPAAQEQEEFMKKGREQLEKLTGQIPSVYVPPNHYFNQDTLEVAEQMGFKFFMDRALISLQPYSHKNMIVVPEADLTRKTPEVSAHYIHYDEIDSYLTNYVQTLVNAEPVTNIKSSPPQKNKQKLNRFLVTSAKIARDFLKAPKHFKS